MRKLIRPEPPEWWEKFEYQCTEELNELVASSPHETIPSGYLSKSRFYRDMRRKSRAVELLAQASGGACHACGTDVMASDPQLEHFRPKINAANHSRDRRAPRHYWWLLADWNNLQVVCAICKPTQEEPFPG